MKNLENDIRKFKERRHRRILLRLDAVRVDYDRPSEDYDWITIKGQHTPIEDGHIAGGIGGKFKGQKYTGSKMTQSKKRQAKLASSIPKTIGVHGSRVAQLLKKYKSFNGLKNVLKKELGVEFSSDNRVPSFVITAKKFSVDMVSDHLGGVVDFLEDFPKVKSEIKSVAGYYGSVSAYVHSIGQVLLHPRFFYDRDQFNKLRDESVAAGRWIKDTSPQSIGVHETAHALTRLLSKGAKADYYEYCEDIVTRAHENLKKRGENKFDSIASEKENISLYAAVRDSETISESFADCYLHGSEAMPLSREIRRIVEEEYRKQFGTSQ